MEKLLLFSRSVVPNSVPMDCSLLGSSVHGILQAEYWNGLPFPFPGDCPNTGIEPGSQTLQADSLPSELPWALWDSTLVLKLKQI